MADVTGTSGADFIHVAGDSVAPYPGANDLAQATASGDEIFSGGGGVDYIYSGAGVDKIHFYDDLTSEDRIDAGSDLGTGDDTIVIHNAISVVFSDTSLKNVEKIELGADVIPVNVLLLHSLTFVDANIAAGALLEVDASSATVDEDVRIDFSAETDGGVYFKGGAGYDTVIGSASAGATIDFSTGGNDSFVGAGEIRFYAAGSFNSGDHIDGLGASTVVLGSGYAGTIVGSMMSHVERLTLSDFTGASYNFTFANDVVAAGERMVIDGRALQAGYNLLVQADAEHDGDYTIYAGGGDDTLLGGDGDDIFIMGEGDGRQEWGQDIVYGSPGDDLVQASGIYSDDKFGGGAGYDTLVLSDAGTIDGNESIIDLVIAADVVDDFEFIQLGAAPYTSVSYNLDISDTGLNAGVALLVDGSRVTDYVRIDAGDVTVSALNFIGGHGADDFVCGALADTVSGRDGDDQMEGGGGADVLSGGDGRDFLLGGAGADTLDGGAGVDHMYGGDGADLYIVNSSADVTIESSSGGGVDTVRSTASRTLGVNLDNLVLLGSSGISGTGNGAANTITGNSAGNTLRGGASNDVLIGGGGADDLRGDGGSDTASYDASTARVRANLNTGAGLDGHAQGDTYDSIERIIGSDFNDVLTGDGVGNVLMGGTGVDIIDGRGGQDSLFGGGGDDVFLFSAGLGAADRIDDFSVGNDTIRLDNNIFTGLAAGALAASAFYIGAAAHDATDRIIYNSANGFLSFDKDGNGAQTAIHFATLDTGLVMTAGDFAVV